MADVIVYWHWQNSAVQRALVDALKYLSRIASRQLDLAPGKHAAIRVTKGLQEMTGHERRKSTDRNSFDDENLNRRKPVSAARDLPEPLLDSDEAASIMKIHPKTLQKLARKGIVRGVHIGKLWRFPASEIEQWIDRQLAS